MKIAHPKHHIVKFLKSKNTEAEGIIPNGERDLR